MLTQIIWGEHVSDLTVSSRGWKWWKLWHNITLYCVFVLNNGTTRNEIPCFSPVWRSGNEVDNMKKNHRYFNNRCICMQLERPEPKSFESHVDCSLLYRQNKFLLCSKCIMLNIKCILNYFCHAKRTPWECFYYFIERNSFFDLVVNSRRWHSIVTNMIIYK